MLRLLADENIPKKIVTRLRKLGVDAVRLQELGLRGISDWQVVEVANKLKRTIITRDSDFTEPHLLRHAEYGVIYLAFQPRKEEVEELSKRIARVCNLEAKRGLLIIVMKDRTEIYG